jgi:hypothetical protein
MSLRCGNEVEDSPNFDATGSLRGTKKETNCFAFLYELETPEEDGGRSFDLYRSRYRRESARSGTRLRVLTGIDAEFLHA